VAGPPIRGHKERKHGSFVILTAVSYNIRVVLTGLRIMLRLILLAQCRAVVTAPTPKPRLLNARLINSGTANSVCSHRSN
jgi:hypothetical protein